MIVFVVGLFTCGLMSLSFAGPTRDEWKLIVNAVQQHNVASLNLGRNEIRKMPDEIANLIGLKCLRVSGMIDAAAHTVIVSHITANRLEHLPESIAQLKNLKGLYVGGMIDAAAHTVHTAAGGDV